MGEGDFLPLKCKGRPREPLAEVILGTPRCAPLRLFCYKQMACRSLSYSKYKSGVLLAL